jgi:RNA polymerase sigma factor (sigma-70 family)
MTSLNGTVRECLQGSVEAFLTLDREMRPRLVGSLQSRGATHSEAEDVAADVLNECHQPGEKSLLNRFNGKREFESWLLRVAINRFIDRQRRQTFFNQDGLETTGAHELGEAPPEQPDATLRRIVRKALAESFAACDSQSRVLLWLTYAHQVKQARLAEAWGWSEAKLSRTLTASRDDIRQRTLSAVKRLEPGLTLLWEDIIDVCAEGQESLFAA